MIKVIGLALIAALCSFVISELGFRGKKLFSVVACILFFSLVCDGVGRMLGEVSPLFEASGISDAAECAVKIVGAGYLFGITSDILSELGEPLLAKGLISLGRVEILLVVFPYIMDIIKLGIRLIG